jgi:acetyltransferase EpsM
MFLYGASGHAKVIVEILESQGIKIDELFDDNESIRSLLKYSVRKFIPELDENKELIISIGDNINRKKIASRVCTDYGMAIHPRAIVSKRSSIGEGTVIMGGVTINVDAHIGRHCIVNTNASIDHDCILEDFAHVSPNVTLCGNVYVGEGTLIGAGTVVIPWKKIGKWCTIGAGSVVIKDIPDYATVAGNPAQIIKTSLSAR